MLRVAAAFAVAFLVSQTHAFAQSAGSASATDVTKAEIEVLMKAFPKGGDQQVRVVDIGKTNVAVGLVRWPVGKRGVLAHSQVTEVYYMMTGSGMLVTGGTMVGPKPLAPEADVTKVLVGPSTSSDTVQNGVTRRIGAGDTVVIPAGVPHQWLTIDEEMSYIVVRVDPDKVLPAGYVHPALKK
jgi:hypothetical protein